MVEAVIRQQRGRIVEWRDQSIAIHHWETSSNNTIQAAGC